MDRLLGITLLSALPILLTAQAYLKNASFEGKAQDATVPASWFPCEEGTTPDILPGPWGVYEEAAEGDTYLGLITREDGTWESVGQRLSATLKAKECYTFTLDVAHSKTYAGYNNPLRLRIWGGMAKCGKDQLLLETDFIREPEWEEFEVQFVPKKPINYIVIEAFYKDGRFSYQGNILIDNFSPIKKCVRAELAE
ncbi:MAG: hypothetical protein KDD02_18835 [Phaeodactylibacter sp.]|nr:hypothetical protein [Phaeodactylibacter sp.]MCB9301632.1 hypothetical protein [Lewinellaceae bacterium]